MRIAIALLFAAACFGQGLQNAVWTGTVDASAATVIRTGAITYPIGTSSAVATPTTGVSVCGESPYAATITGWRVRSLNGTSGSIVVAVTNNGASIVASASPTIVTNTAATGTASTWTKAIAQGDILCFSVSSVTSITYAQVTILVAKQ